MKAEGKSLIQGKDGKTIAIEEQIFWYKDYIHSVIYFLLCFVRFTSAID